MPTSAAPVLDGAVTADVAVRPAGTGVLFVPVVGDPPEMSLLLKPLTGGRPWSSTPT